MSSSARKRQLHSSFSTFSTSYVLAAQRKGHLRQLAMLLLALSTCCLLVATVGTRKLALMHVNEYPLGFWSSRAGEAADSATVRYREDLDIGFFVLGGLHALTTLLGFVALGAQASSLETGTQLRLALLAAESAALVLLGDWTVWIDSPTEGSARRVGPGLVLVSIGTLLSGAATVFVAIETYLAKRSGAKVRRVSNLGAVRGSSKASRSLYSAESGL